VAESSSPSPRWRAGIAVLVSQRAKVKSVFSRDVAGAQSPNDNVSSQAGSTEAPAPDQASVE
jgi:hypothetical protein